jgi:nitrous oxidase accessory protein NosD
MLDAFVKIYDARGRLVNATCTLFEGNRNFVAAVGLRFESWSAVFRANHSDERLTVTSNVINKGEKGTTHD